MALTDTIPPITGIDDPAQARVLLYQAGKPVHAPLDSVGLATDTEMATAIEAAIDSLATAQTRSRIVNGAMQISQEIGDTQYSGVAATSGYYLDQWQVSTVHSAGSFTMGRVQSTTPNGSKNRFRITIDTADASLAASEVLLFYQSIEGNRVADFLYGTASARQAILRFGIRAPAGTYAVSIGNYGGSRSYVEVFTISAGLANTDTEQTLIIPGDTTGTWLTNTGIGMYVTISLAAGSTYHGVLGWQAGNYLNTSACTNGQGTAGNVFELFDVSLQLDPLDTGIPAPWVMPDEAQELAACQRYFNRYSMVVDTNTQALSMSHTVEMRIAPAFTGGGAGFAVASSAPTAFAVYQTARALQNIFVNARM